MKLARLQLSQVRNLCDLDIRPGPSLNIVQGANASGKSSLLEAIHILSCGKSFRTRQLSNVLRHGLGSMTISGEVESPDHGVVPIGLEFDRQRARLRLRARGQPLRKASELASTMPLVSLHQESHRVFTEGPPFRRQFLDWGLFHVEPQFLPAWKRYRRALKQRNAMLQRGEAGISIWDADLVESALTIDRLRRDYLGQLTPIFSELTGMLDIEAAITAGYRPGWDERFEYQQVLRQAQKGDHALRHTRYGPHRADIDFRIDGVAVHERLSRGQLKVLVYALNLAQTLGFSRLTGKKSVLLLDDLTAELDERHTKRLLDEVEACGLQVFITSSEPRLAGHIRERQHKMFHVERGRLTEVL